MNIVGFKSILFSQLLVIVLVKIFDFKRLAFFPFTPRENRSRIGIKVVFYVALHAHHSSHLLSSCLYALFSVGLVASLDHSVYHSRSSYS